MNELVLEMKRISKRFPGVLALNDVSIHLGRGEILSIVGENGAGKTTLMRILAGVYPHGSYDGEILLNDRPFIAKNTRDAEKAGIAMIYQELNVELDLTIGENILLGNWPKKKNQLVDWKKLHAKAREALSVLDVSLNTRISMRYLNASLQQLVCIARALAKDPHILILDEPTAALTETETENLMKILRQLKSKEISCIYISHKLDEVFDISDRVVTMRDACVVSEYSKEDIVPEKVIEDIVGRKIVTAREARERNFSGEALRIENFVVKHPYTANKNIIEDVSISLKKGEVLGLTGLVGSGRSELLRAIFGVLPKVRGDVYIDGQLCQIHETKDAIEQGICMLSEDRKFDGYVSTMNIRENMTLSSLKKVSQRTFINRNLEKKLARQHFDYLKIKAASPEISIVTLSGGNQQKVIIAKSLLTDAKILFLDEPTRGVDVGTKNEIYKIIGDLSRKGISIIIISSELPELIGLCDRFIVLCNGYISAEFSSANVSQQAILHAAAFGGQQNYIPIMEEKGA
jgi:D-xylose transport system ATP-binding protein